MRASIIVLVAAAAVSVLGQSGAWGQCGGIGYSGPTTCISGYTCKKQNNHYFLCLLKTATPSSSRENVPSTLVSSVKTSATPSFAKPSSTSVKPSTTPSSARSTPWWFGVNLSGAEFGEKNFTGVYGREYIWYDHSAIDTLISKGMNMFRVNFLMERLTPNSLTAPLDPLYVGNLTADINYITSKGAYAMVQPHNYGRFYGSIITDTAAFQTWWKNVAALYKNNPLVVFDTNNEYHDMDQQLVYSLNQAAINGIRAAGATKQYITPEGNNWTGAWTWVTSGNGGSLVSLTDPTDASGSKIIYQMHQYLDIDGSGTHDECVSATIFQERLTAATNWLRAHNKKGLLGEYASGSNPTCIAALQGGLQYLKANSDVWTGHLWWAAGPWWGDYSYSMEPSTGNAFVNILPSILPYAS